MLPTISAIAAVRPNRLPGPTGIVNLIRHSSPLAGPNGGARTPLLRAPVQDVFSFRRMATGVVTLLWVISGGRAPARRPV
jgi:hypothetical protein